MNLTDPIGDMLTRIRNASRVKAEVVEMPHSSLKNNLARVLKREGFIHDYTAESGGAKKRLRLYLKYDAARDSVVRGLKRVSKPGLRRYVSYKDLKPVLSGTGLAIISTSRGLLTDREARKQRLGGEWLCTIW